MDKNPITKDGEKAIKSELHQLKTVDRPNISQAIAEARAHGDLKKTLNIMQLKSNKAFLSKRLLKLKPHLLIVKS